MNTFSPKNKKKVANGLQIFMIFVIFLPIPLFIPSFFISVKQQHNHNSQYPEKCHQFSFLKMSNRVQNKI